MALSKTALRDRWKGPGQAMARDAVERLITGEPFTGWRLGKVNGRTDLRGLWLESARGLSGYQEYDPLPTLCSIPGATWQSLDLSASNLVVDLNEAHLRDVVFHGATWRNWRIAASTLEHCSFVRAQLGDCAFDGWNCGVQDIAVRARPSAYLECDFSEAKLGVYTTWGRATLTGCLFDSTRFPSPLWFRGAALRRCRFRGPFRTLCFGWTGPYSEPPPWVDVDVSEASCEYLDVYAHAGPGVLEDY